jgi:hypothetical protein
VVSGAAEILEVIHGEMVLEASEELSCKTLIGLIIEGSSLSVGKRNDVC